MALRSVFKCLFWCSLWFSARGALESPDVFMMVRGLHEALMEQTCTVIGASTDEECSSFKFAERQFLSPSQIAASLANPKSGDALFVLDETNAAALLDGWIEDLWPKLSEKATIVEEMVDQVEQLYTEDKDAMREGLTFLNETKSGLEQVGWTATRPSSGNFAGIPVNMQGCAYHFPSTAPLDRRRTNSDAMVMHQMCDVFQQNLDVYEEMGVSFQFLSSIHGVSAEYPGTLRGLGYDNRFEVWFKRSIFPPKDVVIVVDQSGSMDGNRKCGAMAFASAQVHALVRAWVTPQDMFQLLLVADEPHVSPCSEGNLVPGFAENVEEMLAWFGVESLIDRGQGSLANGVLEALNILESAEEGGTTSGGAKFIVVISDALMIQDIVEEGIKKFAMDHYPPLETPMPGLHLIGVSVGDLDRRSILDEAACLQAGLAWKVYQPPEATGTDCPLDIQPFTTSERGAANPLMVDSRFLLNITTLLSLSAWPRTSGSDLVQWGPVRAGVEAGRSNGIMSVGKVYFDRRSNPPRLRGAAGLEFSISEVWDIILEWDKPDLSHVLLVQYREDVGLCLAHSLVPPSYSDYLDEQVAQGDLDLRVQDLEGPNFEVSGTLQRIAEEEAGFSTVERTLTIESNGYVRPTSALTTYWWKRIPQTAFALVAAMAGRPATSTESMLVPSIRNPKPCPPNVSNPYATQGNDARFYGCWLNKYANWPSGYHRFDLARTVSPLRFSGQWGGSRACSARLCTYDSSAWLGLSVAFRSSSQFTINANTTLQDVQNLDRVLTGDATDGGVEGGDARVPLPGKGLQSHAAADVKISANMELFWKEVMGVRGVGEDGRPTSLDMSEEMVNRRTDILQLFFLSNSGIMRFFPGSRMDDRGRNYMKESWYARAISVPDLVSVSSPRWVQDQFNATWAVTVSKASLFLPAARGNAGRTSSTSEHGMQDILFGVVGAHFRLSGFARLFRRATSLQSVFKYGCGDMGTSAAADDGLACLLLNERTRIVMDRELLLLGDQPPDEMQSSPSFKELYQSEPLLMQYLMTASAVTSERLQYGFREQVQYQVNQSVLEEWTQDKRESAARAGLPPPEYTGIQFNVRGEGTFGGYTIWFYQIPGFNLYMLTVTGYEPLRQQPYCGFLSLSCPAVFEPIQSINKQSSCEAPVPPRASSGPAYNAPSNSQLLEMREWPTGEQGFVLSCPQPLEVWVVALIVIAIILVSGIVIGVLCIWKKHYNKMRSTQHFMAKRHWESKGQEKDTSGGPGIEADTFYYVKLGEKQQQLGEDLSQRDEGDRQANHKELLALNSEVSGMQEQMDYLQQRIQKQEIQTSKFDHFRRKVLKVCDHATELAAQVEAQKQDGNLTNLDPMATARSEGLAEALMEQEVLQPGTREQMFHRMYFPSVVTFNPTPRNSGNGVNGTGNTSVRSPNRE